MSNEWAFTFVIFLQAVVMFMMSLRMDRMERRIRNLDLEVGIEPDFE